MAEHRLQNRRILVVEDDYFLATDLEEELTEAGATVVGPAPTVEAALALIERTALLAGATLDVNLGGELVYPVVDRLMTEGVPFLLTTGYSERDIPARYAAAPRAEKPVYPRVVASTLARMMSATEAS